VVCSWRCCWQEPSDGCTEASEQSRYGSDGHSRRRSERGNRPDMTAAILEGRFEIKNYLAAIADGARRSTALPPTPTTGGSSCRCCRTRRWSGWSCCSPPPLAPSARSPTLVATRLVPAFQAHVMPLCCSPSPTSRARSSGSSRATTRRASSPLPALGKLSREGHRC